MELKIIAQRGREEDGTLIIQTDESHGFMVYAEGAVDLSRPMFPGAFLKFGYWTEPSVTMPQEELQRLAVLPIEG